MCAECHSWPHLPGCPEGPEPEPVYVCDWCGEPVYEEEYFDMEGDKACPACVQARKRLF